MKDLLEKISSGDVPMEWALAAVGAGLLVLLVAALALRERPKQRGPSAFGLVLCLLGALTMAFFFFQFDVSVLANGMRIVNLDLRSQRQNGILIGGILFLAGILVMALRGRSKPENPPDK